MNVLHLPSSFQVKRLIVEVNNVMLNLKSLGIAAVGATCITIGTGNVAQAATFLGNAVQVDAALPFPNVVPIPLGTEVIDADGETFTSRFVLGASALVRSSTIQITHLDNRSYLNTPFNGFRFSDVNGTINSIIGVSLISSNVSGFDISRVTFNANRIFVDLGGLNVRRNQTTSFNVLFAANPAGPAIPTPALLPGLIGMGVGVLRKRKALTIASSEA